MFPRKKEKPKEEQQQVNEQSEQKTTNTQQPGEDPPKQVSHLQKQVEDLKKEKDDLFAKLQRLAADYENYQKRSAKQITDSVAYEKEKIIKALLPVLDDFERALAHAEDGDSVAEGIKLVYEHFKGVLRAQGIEQIETAGQRFDPAMHEAIVQQCDESKDDEMILDELQKGYKLNGRLIRASKVLVNKLPVKTEQSTEEDETKDTQ
jgi:molecular chaperone GrpE